jgi:hypothetical protein
VSVLSLAWRAFVLAAGLALPGPAFAGQPAPDKASYTLLNPTPDGALRDMSTDRPDKTESPYTVDAGRVQVETDLIAFTRDEADGVATDRFDVLPFNLKIGLNSVSDIQFVYGSFSQVRREGRGLVDDRERGGGDLLVRYKHNLWGNDGGRTAFAIMPFVKLPTGTVRDAVDDVEAGLILPLAIDLGHGVGLGLMSEIGVVRRETGEGYAPAFIHSATLSFELTKRLGAYSEVYTERSSEAGSETIVTLDAGLTYAVTDHLQLDAGVNVGVTDAADDLNAFAGLSRRF